MASDIADFIAPTPERARRGVELLGKAIADEAGRPSQPYRSIDILAAMERRGAITPEMRQAGEEFQNLFRMAQLDPLKAADYTRPMISGAIIGDISYRARNARESVWLAIVSVGGLSSPGGSCLWNVLGWEMSLKQWAIEQGLLGRRVSRDGAQMVLITVLGVLAHRATR